ncbi:MAG: methionine--tRNA ligase [Ardenticatenales bacterium]|nr:methionine--tRNA ligase [Ardenticatenales bacterium]
MSDTIGIFVAWPYANGDLHLGHVAGAYLPADVFARYHRLKGNRVLMVSGSDTHGTPITVQAKEEGVTPRAVFERYHHQFLKGWQGLGITFDLYTHTDTENHHAIAQSIFRKLYEQEDLYVATEKQLYDEQAGQFLADRYVEGTCPYCGFENARGDQCDNCGRTLDAPELKNPRSRLSGTTPVIRESEHFFINLPAYAEELRQYIEAQEHWRPTVRNFVLAWLKEGLKPRSMTRDLGWGIPSPVEGWEQKVMYVWFEAVIGYLSGSIEWAKNQGTPEAWEKWWKDKEARTYYFIGKDNTPFHTVLWVTELLGYDRELNIPYDVPANEFLNLEGQQFSKSRRWAIWLPDFLERYDPDPLRYYLTAIAPETKDADFTWDGFVTRNNSELIAAWGNLANRVLSFAHKRYDGKVPVPQALDKRDKELLQTIEQGFESVGALYEQVRLRDALKEAMSLAREVNRYLDEKAPWKAIKEDPGAAGTSVYVALRAIDSLKIILAPVLPHTSQQLHEFFGYQEPLFGQQREVHYEEATRGHDAVIYEPTEAEQGSKNRWKLSTLQPGTPIQPPTPLFKILDEAIIEEEVQRLGTDDIVIR